MAKEAQNNGGNVTYFKINQDGMLYTGSKEPIDGYEKIQLKDGSDYYQKTYVSSDDGYLSFLGVVEKNYPTGKVKELVISVKGSTGIDNISVPLFYQKRLTDYAKNLATILPNVDFSQRVCINPSKKKTEKNGKKYLQRSLFINLPDAPEGENLVKFAHKYGKEGDIPGFEKIVGVDGTPSYDFKAQDTYLYNILTEQIERFKSYKENSKSVKNQESSTPVENNPVENSTPPVLENTTADDLPF